MATVFQRLRSGWNAFIGRDPTNEKIQRFVQSGYAYSSRPDRFHGRMTSAKAVVAKAYNRIALDTAMINIVHGRVDDEGNYIGTIKDGLNECLTLSANLDQTGMLFKQDVIQSMFDEGCIAIVPVNTSDDPTTDSEAYDILSMRVGRIEGWYPTEVKLEVYNELDGKREYLKMPKKAVAIVENPFYSVMNEPNSTLQNLLRTIQRLDAYNEQNVSGKLDLIIQLPYVIKSEQKRKEAENRRQDLIDQLTGSPLGVGYIDGTEKVVQLNRSLENNLWQQVKDLTSQLYNELGLTQAIIDGSADEQTYINYFDHTISPICTALCDEMTRKFLSPTARTQGQRIVYFRDPFRLVPVSQLADIADKMRRNEIMTTNEIRAKIGLKPSQSKEANELRNPNLNKSAAEQQAQSGTPDAGDLTQNDQEIQATGDQSQQGQEDLVDMVLNNEL